MLDQQTITTILISGATTLTVKAASVGIVNSLVDLWNGAIGHCIHSWSEKRRLIMEEKFIPSIAEKISKIPDKNLQEPKMSILGPTLEASKFYIEEEEIREMFSNLIAASMDSDYNTSIQNSFVEIIKQLTPYDAKLFKTFFHHGGNPAMSVIKRNQNESLEILIELFYKNYYFQDYILNEISINNLERLGLIQIKYNEYISFDIFYEEFKNSEIVSKLKQSYNIETRHFCFKLTPFGLAFRKVCIKDSWN